MFSQTQNFSLEQRKDFRSCCKSVNMEEERKRKDGEDVKIAKKKGTGVIQFLATLLPPDTDGVKEKTASCCCCRLVSIATGMQGKLRGKEK